MRRPLVPMPPMPDGFGAPVPPRGVYGPRRRPAPGAMPGVPVGAIIAFAGDVAGIANPDKTDDRGGYTHIAHFGWRVCNGQDVPVAEYPDLFAAIGFTYGKKGDRFCLPKYDGYFLRAVDPSDDGKGDPDKDKRKVMGGDEDYRGVGSVQDSAVIDHFHFLSENEPKPPPATNEKGMSVPVLGPLSEGTRKSRGISDPSDDKVSQKETRAKNVYVYWLIKCLPDQAPTPERTYDDDRS